VQPELRALGLLKPQAQDVALTVEVDSEREVASAALHAAAFTDLEHQAVQEHDGVHVIQGPRLPRPGVVHDGVGDGADQLMADVDAIDLRQVGLDIADRQAAGIERDDLLVKAFKAPLTLAYDLGFKGAAAIAWRLDPDRAVLGHERLWCRAVARVARAARR
jgi:hypothetical protein